MIAMCANDTMNDGVPDMILDFNIIHNSPRVMDQLCCGNTSNFFFQTHEDMKNWFSMYTKCSDIWIAGFREHKDDRQKIS